VQAKRLECDGQEGVACLIERIQVAGVPCGRMRGDAIALDQGDRETGPREAIGRGAADHAAADDDDMPALHESLSLRSTEPSRP